MTNEFPNLLPQSVRHQRLIFNSLRCWAIVWLVVALVTFWFCKRQHRQIEELERSAALLAAEVAPLTDLEAEYTMMQKEAEAIRSRESWLVDADSQQTLQLLGIISRAAGTNNGRISVQTLTLSTIDREVKTADTSAKSGGRKKDKATEQRMQLELNGIAIDDLAVASFVSVLREASVFESVELKSSVRQIFNNHDTRQYNVTCIY